MNIYLKGAACLLFAILTTSPSFVAADEQVKSDQAYQNYRCDALTQLGRMTDADQKVCDELLAGGFDLAAWEADSPDQSIRLHEEVFSEFF